MKLRSNISFLFYYISFLLLLVTMVSMISLFQLGGAIDSIIRENLPSTIAGEKMSENLTQIHLLILNHQDSALMEYNSDINILADDFTESLINVKNNITISGESNIIKEIEINFSRYIKTIRTIKNEVINNDTQHALSELFRKNIALIKQLISINNQAIITADEDAETLAKSRSIWMIFIALVCFISVFYLIKTIKGKFSEPISNMLLTLQRVNFGDNNIRLSKRDGELGELAEHINNLLDSKKSDQSNTLIYAFEQRDLLSALVELNMDPLFIFDVGYRLVLSNEKARHILKNNQIENFESKLYQSIAQETTKLQTNNSHYHSKVSVLRDQCLNKIGYAITLSKSKP